MQSLLPMLLLLFGRVSKLQSPKGWLAMSLGGFEDAGTIVCQLMHGVGRKQIRGLPWQRVGGAWPAGADVMPAGWLYR